MATEIPTIATPTSNSVLVLENRDGVSLGGPRPAAVPGGAGFVKIADVTGDGRPDLLATSLRDSTVSVIENLGNRSFGSAISYEVGGQPTSVTAGDFDGDGDTDMAVSNGESWTLSILLNHGDGTFAAAVSSRRTRGTVHRVVAGDFDGDGDVDLAAGTSRECRGLPKRRRRDIPCPGVVQRPDDIAPGRGRR